MRGSIDADGRARMAADCWDSGRSRPLPELQHEASGSAPDRCAVTFIAAAGPSSATLAKSWRGIATVENHAQRPDIIDARASGIGDRGAQPNGEFGMRMSLSGAASRRSGSADALPPPTSAISLDGADGDATALGFALLGGAASLVFSARISKRVRLTPHAAAIARRSHGTAALVFA